jgi:hypothetical protein
MENEIWLPIKGFEGIYEISSLGRVKRLSYFKKIGNSAFQPCPERILKTSDDGHGYLKYELCYNSKRTFYKLHSLVAIHFIDNPENKKTVNHKDGDKRNNSINNLEWATQDEQNKHKYKVLKYKRIMPFGEDHRDSIPVFSVSGGIIEHYTSISGASRDTGSASGNIVKCLKGKYKTCGGKKWYYNHSAKVIKPHIIIEYREA